MDNIQAAKHLEERAHLFIVSENVNRCSFFGDILAECIKIKNGNTSSAISTNLCYKSIHMSAMIYVHRNHVIVYSSEKWKTT